MRAFDLQSGSTNAPARIHHAEVKLSHRAPVPVPRITPIDGALLQRKPGCACGGDCPRCQGQHGVQTKLKVNTPGDQYEQEADRVAEQVMQMPGPFRLRGATGFTKQPDTVVQRKCARCDDEDEGFIQKKAPASHEGATNKLNISPPGDAYEQEADYAAEQVMRIPDSHTASGAVHLSTVPESPQHRKTATTSATQATKEGRSHPPHELRAKTTEVVDRAIGSAGRPLEAETRTFMEARFGYDLGHLRVHTETEAAESAKAVNALAYTVGRDIIFGPGQYAPHTNAGQRLLAHELAHTIQQGGSQPKHLGMEPLVQRQIADESPDQVNENLLSSAGGSGGSSRGSSSGGSGSSSGSSGGGGDCDDPFVRPRPGFRVCARALQGALGMGGRLRHAYIEADPNRYAIITRCKPTSGWDNVVTGTAAQKTDVSPDPCCKDPTCVECVPKPGITDMDACFRSAFSSYSDPSLYRGLGPNSNTFAGTLARACCDNMVPKPAALGTVPGWGDPPAPGRAATCPPGPPRC